MPIWMPVIICRLCDEHGKVLSAYNKDAVRFTELLSPESRMKRRVPKIPGGFAQIRPARILITGYVSICIDGQNLSAPIPFRIVRRIWICAPERAELSFTVNNFVCQATPLFDGCAVRISIGIETRVCALEETKIKAGDAFATVKRTIDTVRMLSRACLIHPTGRIKAKTSQYTAIADGMKRVFTNEDELKEYGGEGIHSPECVSHYNVFVNGVIQPKANYRMSKGRLEFVTEDVPSKGATVIIKYVTFKNKACIRMTDGQYLTIADGVKRVYTNDDALKEYSKDGIPGPDEVSYCNLYVNGVLQPKDAYMTEKGRLTFLTENIPAAGRSIILESIAIKNAYGNLMKAEEYQYDILAHHKRAYCSDDDLTPYGKGILAPCETSYQDLCVNAVYQPKKDYMADNGCLVLKTADLPSDGTPLNLHSVRVTGENPRRTHFACICLCYAALMGSKNGRP